ncbi:MAG: UDP-N-acetylmuramoyl-tripeptide--D-alanyl-D-alanine ligase [Candidatus Pacebacteria bacterium]|nr:UDP-N-acetylmuramoyl-tripeptide--D-alanyl-D-alanine ligase [Candidatus Paceibacterota bacterium]MBP9851743.1 UDP-N-acetylmuramoyl-tripeptide--D-alanyl-D-alanine ligase [Candidatus Paceibacterota bacterium]
MISLFKNAILWLIRKEAKAVLKKYKPKVVLITGSIGKTSTKDAIFAVLSQFAHVRKSEKSYNSDFGIPLSILGLESGWRNPLLWAGNLLKGLKLIISKQKTYPEWLVLEVGARKPGDIQAAAGWVKADVVVMTAIGSTPPHIEFYESLQHLVEEKATLIRDLRKSGTFIVNADDPLAFDMQSKTDRPVISYGESAHATIQASHLSIHYSQAAEVPAGISFKAKIGNSSIPVNMRWVFGKNHMYAAIAALAVAHSQHFDLLKAAKALEAYEVPNGRMRLIDGVRGTFIIDDSYNASPQPMESAIETLGNIQATGRKIAVIGDMLELGKFTEDAHRRAGAKVAEAADMLLTVGIRAKFVSAEAAEHGMKKTAMRHVSNATEAGEYLKDKLEKGDVVLVKGSQAMRMERVVKKIMAHPELAPRLLVRQENEWLRKK